MEVEPDCLDGGRLAVGSSESDGRFGLSDMAS